MKRFLLLCLASPLLTVAQGDTSIKLDLLRAPASPASNILGIAPSDIERPTDVSAFMLSLYSATGELVALPRSYAVDIAPYWFFKNSNKGDITTKGLSNSSGANVFKQTLVLSFAFKNPDSTETLLNPSSVYGGFGFKFSLFRGRYDAVTENTLQSIKRLQDVKLRGLDSVLEAHKRQSDPEVLALERRQKELFRKAKTTEQQAALSQSEEFKEIQIERSQRLHTHTNKEKTEAQVELNREIQALASSFQTARVGFTWDVAGGLGSEFRNKRFDASRLYNAGLWTTAGYTSERWGAGLLLLRFLHNPDKVFALDNAVNTRVADVSTFDAGLRYLYTRPQGRFSASLEAVYRSVLSSNTVDPSWRLVFNAEYAVWANQKLTFSFGRNFDGTVSKDGNLIAALNFLTGFGNRR